LQYFQKKTTLKPILIKRIIGKTAMRLLAHPLKTMATCINKQTYTLRRVFF